MIFMILKKKREKENQDYRPVRTVSKLKQTLQNMNTVPHQKEMYLPNFQESKPITMEYIHKRDLIVL